MTDFTPWSALAGGLLVGVSAVILLALTGRIAGVSGILNGLLARTSRSEASWRLAFLAGLVAGAALYWLFAVPPAAHAATPLGMAAAAGFLVGLGTKAGNGCTSGHGVCGLGRLSLRSLAATLTFLLAGMATVYAVRHVLS